MVVDLLMFAAGLGALVVGAELLVRGASRLALSMGISPLVVGLTVVAFGTSSPEGAVSVQSAWSGQIDLAIGNVIGSNLFNVLVVLGVCAIVAPLAVGSQVIRQEVPILIAASLLLVGVTLDGGISRIEAAVLFALLLAYTAFVIRQSRAGGNEEAVREFEAELAAPADSPRWDDPRSVQLLLIVGGLALLVTGSNWLVAAAVSFATAFGVSELIVGLTIVAAGTSLPELAASLVAVLRGERDIAVGNVIGSNLFNILGVLGVAGIVSPTALQVPASVLYFDLPAMVAVAIACLPVFFSERRIGRWEGAMFIAYYVAYIAYLVLDARGYHALETYREVMLFAVIPLTVVTIAVVTWRSATPR
ncbi:MAG TPA: calcium/sodium antiporter [Burkholderiaceae bacterium]|jgi:cation:H+ antiporter|nr:calcium/sodium antiporter [Burkholderiaceae bacterium]